MPDRTDSRTTSVSWPLETGRRIFVTANFEGGRVVGVFLRGGGQVGSDIDFLLDDAAITMSRALQHGDTVTLLADGVSRSPQGVAMSLLGVVADELVILEREYAREET